MGEAPFPTDAPRPCWPERSPRSRSSPSACPPPSPRPRRPTPPSRYRSVGASDADSSQYTVPTTSPVSSPVVIVRGEYRPPRPLGLYVEPDPFVKATRYAHSRHQVTRPRPRGHRGPTPRRGALAAPLVAARWRRPRPPRPRPRSRRPVRPSTRPAPLVPVDPIPTLVAPATPPPAPLATGAPVLRGLRRGDLEGPGGLHRHRLRRLLGLGPRDGVPDPGQRDRPRGGELVPGDRADPRAHLLLHRPGPGRATSSAPSNEVSAFPSTATRRSATWSAR